MKCSDAEFIEFAKQAKSLKHLLELQGLKAAGGNYATIRRRLAKLGIPTPKLVGAWNKGFTYKNTAKSIEKYLRPNMIQITSSELRKRLVKAGIKPNRCETTGCPVTSEWLGKPISLHLEHVDGDHTNNTITNLLILCPNCHTQTKTYGKLKSPVKKITHRPRIRIQCNHCKQAKITRQNKTGLCRDCKTSLNGRGSQSGADILLWLGPTHVTG